MEHEFESREQAGECLTCFYKGYVPLKFAFSGSAARTHDRLASGREYHSVVAAPRFESRCIVEFMMERVRSGESDKYDWVEIGPGNARHSAALWRMLPSKIRPPRVLLIDYSSVLLRLASWRLRQLVGAQLGILFSRGLWDIEAGYSGLITSFLHGRPGIVLFMGNTIANVERPDEVMRNLRLSVTAGCLVFISWAGYEKTVPPQEYLAPYRTDELLMAATEPLRMLGVNVQAEKFILEFNKDERCVYGVYNLESADLCSESMIDASAVSNWSIRCFKSLRFDEQQFRSLAHDSGFSVERVWWNESERVHIACLT